MRAPKDDPLDVNTTREHRLCQSGSTGIGKLTTLLIVVISLVDGQSWQPDVSLPVPLSSASAVSLTGTLYVVGGTTTTALGDDSSPFVYALNTLDPVALWTTVATLPVNVSGSGTAVALDSSETFLVCVGCEPIRTTSGGRGDGSETRNASNAFWGFNTNSRQWRRYSNATTSRIGASVIRLVDQNRLMLVGGVDESGAPQMRVEIFDVATEEWLWNETYVVPMWFACCNGAGTYVSGSVFLFSCLDCTPNGQPSGNVLQINTYTGVFTELKHSELRHVALQGPGTIGQYGVIFAATATAASPTVYLFDFCALTVASAVGILGQFEERNQCATAAVSNTLFVAGGRDLTTSHSTELVTSLTNVVPLPRISSSHDANNNVYFLGQNVVLALSSGSPYTYVRLAESYDCLPNAAIPDVAVTNSADGSTATISSPPLGRYAVCVSNGVCSQDIFARHPCQSPGILTMVDCLGVYCCWDITWSTCYSYSPRNTTDDWSAPTLYWVAVSSPTIDVVQPPPNTTAAPLTTSAGTSTSTTTTTTTTAPTILTTTTTVAPSPSSSPTPVVVTTTTTAIPSAPPVSSSWFTPEHLAIVGCVLLLLLMAALATAVVMWRRGGFHLGRSSKHSVHGERESLLIVPRRSPRSGHNGSDGSTTAVADRQVDAAQSTTRKYKIISRLGRGAHGIVYLVERVLPPHQRYAMKYIPCDDVAELQLALKEFEVIRSLHGTHPNVIALIDMFMDWPANVEKSPSQRPSLLRSNSSLGGSPVAFVPLPPGVAQNLQMCANGDRDNDLDDGEAAEEELHRYVCIVMEYFPDGDLRHFITEYPSGCWIDQDTVVHIGVQICSALSFLHQHVPPIVHRDIKPENILVALPPPPPPAPSLVVPHSAGQQQRPPLARRARAPGWDGPTTGGTPTTPPSFHSAGGRSTVGAALPPLLSPSQQRATVAVAPGTVMPSVIVGSRATESPSSRAVPASSSTSTPDAAGDSVTGVASDNEPPPPASLINFPRVVLTDFGLAHNADKTHMTTRAGTLHYAAPESWKGNYTSAVDMWALGCVLYVLCTRRVTPNVARVMFSDVLDPEFHSEVLAELCEERCYSPSLAEIVLKLLKVDAAVRPTAPQTLELLMGLLPTKHAKIG